MLFLARQIALAELARDGAAAGLVADKRQAGLAPGALPGRAAGS
jgi:hypothetical protein